MKIEGVPGARGFVEVTGFPDYCREWIRRMMKVFRAKKRILQTMPAAKDLGPDERAPHNAPMVFQEKEDVMFQQDFGDDSQHQGDPKVPAAETTVSAAETRARLVPMEMTTNQLGHVMSVALGFHLNPLLLEEVCRVLGSWNGNLVAKKNQLNELPMFGTIGDKSQRSVKDYFQVRRTNPGANEEKGTRLDLHRLIWGARQKFVIERGKMYVRLPAMRVCQSQLTTTLQQPDNWVSIVQTCFGAHEDSDLPFMGLVTMLLSVVDSDKCLFSLLRRMRFWSPARMFQWARTEGGWMCGTYQGLLRTLAGHMKCNLANKKAVYIFRAAVVFLFHRDKVLEPAGMLALDGVGLKILFETQRDFCGRTIGIGCDRHMCTIFQVLGWVDSPAGPARQNQHYNSDIVAKQMMEWVPPEAWGIMNRCYAGLGQLLQDSQDWRVAKQLLEGATPSQRPHIIAILRAYNVHRPRMGDL